MKKGKNNEENKYYSLDRILELGATYNMIIGERSNGKTYAVLQRILDRYWDSEGREQGCIIRRWDTDYRGKNGQNMFAAMESNGYISRLTGGEWSGTFYWAGRWYLCRYEGESMTRVREDTPFCYGFSLNAGEHDKSTSYPGITTILFDEFITRQMYLKDEFVIYMNVLSTIIRDRNNVSIFMCANTVNKYCPYFAEMGLNHIEKMKQGDIDLYRYGSSKLTVAVEYCKPRKGGKPSDVYFAFDNPKLSMITGGEWEIDIYPHIPYKHKPKDILFTYFIIFSKKVLQCEIINIDNAVYTYIHRKTGDIRYPDTDLIFTPDFDPRPNYRRNLARPADPLGRKIFSFFQSDKIFYQDNEVGEIVRNYLMWCGKNKM